MDVEIVEAMRAIGGPTHSYLGNFGQVAARPPQKLVFFAKGDSSAFSESQRVVLGIRSFAGVLSSSPYWPAHSPRA